MILTNIWLNGVYLNLTSRQTEHTENKSKQNIINEMFSTEQGKMLFLNLAANNSVRPTCVSFEFTSPDELAFVHAGKYWGVN